MNTIQTTGGQDEPNIFFKIYIPPKKSQLTIT